MSKKEANLTAIVIVQQLDESYWHWDDTSPVKKAREGDCKQLLEEITKRLEENEIKDNLDFTITSEDEANLDTPTLYNNLANPITLSYVNQNIKSDYTITDTSIPITYDGSLLKRCNIALNSISCSFSFDIYITNNLDEEFKSTVFINIPLETQEKSIYDGNINMTQNTNFIFYRFK